MTSPLEVVVSYIFLGGEILAGQFKENRQTGKRIAFNALDKTLYNILQG